MAEPWLKEAYIQTAPLSGVPKRELAKKYIEIKAHRRISVSRIHSLNHCLDISDFDRMTMVTQIAIFRRAIMMEEAPVELIESDKKQMWNVWRSSPCWFNFL
tara:strand:+ start:166 stop:471 length:306 start_codon:yes stop_codon:yes gene_type:complete